MSTAAALSLNDPRAWLSKPAREDFDYRSSSLQREGADDISSKLSNVTGHSQSSSLRHLENGVDEDQMKSGTTTEIYSTTADPTNENRTKLHRALVLHVSDPAKVVAKKIEASHRTVESHRQKVPDSWAALIAYCRAYPAFGLEVLDLMGIDIDRDRAAYSTFLALSKQVRGEP